MQTSLFERQLKQWCEDFCPLTETASREASGAFRKLQRQQKVLVEVVALLVLQKKIQALLKDADK